MKILSIFLLMAIAASAVAQEGDKPKQDNTGTNPVNFTYDARFYTEVADLFSMNADDDGSLITSTFEFRLPLGRDIVNVAGLDNEHLVDRLGQIFAARIRFRYKSLSVSTTDINGEIINSTVSGIGDLDARILSIAYVSKTQRFILAPGLEATFPTASSPALGWGKTVLMPVVFGAFPGLLGKGSLFAPGYQYLFSVGGDEDRPDISRSQIDLYFVWLLGKGSNWLIVDPQIVIDHINNTYPALLEVEWGTMIKPVPGASVYLRPGVGFFEDRPYVWNFEFGLKFVWR